MSSIHTMKSWAVKIDVKEKIPAVFQKTMEQVLKECTDIPYMIYAPRNEKKGKPAQDTLLAMSGKVVWILLDEDEEATVFRFPMDEIQVIQVGNVLLQSWIKVCGHTSNGNDCVTVYFDTVVEELFVPLVETVRSHMIGIDSESGTTETEELNYLKEMSLKFYNYAVQSVLPGQKVCCSVFQPGVLGMASSSSSDHDTTPSLLVLTDEELTVIQETKQEKGESVRKYSGIWSHVPRRAIVRVATETLDEGWEQLEVGMTGQEPIKTLWDPRNKQALQRVTSSLKTRKKNGKGD